jgi:hypothetical protein
VPAIASVRPSVQAPVLKKKKISKTKYKKDQKHGSNGRMLA